VRSPGQQSSDGGRWAGNVGRRHRQAQRQEGAAALQRQDSGGIAGSTADALALFTRFENKLQEYHGNLARAAVELAKEWRTERSLRHLEALLVVADAKGTFLLSGTGT